MASLPLRRLCREGEETLRMLKVALRNAALEFQLARIAARSRASPRKMAGKSAGLSSAFALSAPAFVQSASHALAGSREGLVAIRFSQARTTSDILSMACPFRALV